MSYYDDGDFNKAETQTVTFKYEDTNGMSLEYKYKDHILFGPTIGHHQEHFDAFLRGLGYHIGDDDHE